MKALPALSACIALVLTLCASPTSSASPLPLVPIIQDNHSQRIGDIAYSPDGKYFATASEFESVAKLWRAADGSLVRNLSAGAASVGSLFFTPDSRDLIVVSRDRVDLWRVADGALLRSIAAPDFEGDPPKWTLPSLSPDGSFLVLDHAPESGSDKMHDYTDAVIILGLADGNVRFRFKDETRPLLSPDGKRLVSRIDNYHSNDVFLVIRSLDSPERVTKLAGDYRLAAFSPDGRYLVIQDRGKAQSGEALLVYETEGMKLIKRQNIDRSLDWLSFSRKGDVLVGGTDYGSDFYFMDFPSLSGYQTLDTKSSGASYRNNWREPCGDRIVALSREKGKEETRLVLIDVAARRIERSAEVKAPLESLYLSPDRKSAIACRDRENAKNPFLALDLESGKVLYPGIESHSLPLSSIAFSPDGQRFAVADTERGFFVYKTGEGVPLLYVSHENCQTVAFSRDNAFVASAAFDKRRTVKVFKVADGSLVTTLTGLGLPASSLEFSGDGKRLLAAGDAAIVWDIASGGVVLKKERTGRDLWFNAHFSPDCKTIAAAGGEMYGSYGSLAAWNADTGEELFSMPQIMDHLVSIGAFSNDGKALLISGSETSSGATKPFGLVATVSAKDGRKLIEVREKDYIGCACYSRDGALVATASGDKVTIRKASTLAATKVLSGHRDGVTDIAFSPDGKLLVSASRDASIRVWNIAAGTSVSLVPFDTGDWFVYDDSGRFDCSDGGRRFVRFVQGEVSFGCEQFWKDYYSPGLFARFRAGEKFPPLAIAATALQAPAVRIAQPSGFLETDSPTLSVSVRADPGSGGVGRILLLHNGKVLDEKTRGLDVRLAPGVKVFTITLVEGENRLVGAAYDASGAMEGRSEPLIVEYRPAREGARPDLYILACGVSEYKDKAIRLGSPRDDAVAVAAALGDTARSLYGSVHATVLTDKDASAKGVMRAFNDIAAKARPVDTVILYLAGHGLCSKGVYYYLTYEADVADIENTTLTIDDIGEFIKTVAANKRALFLDTCYSGGAAKKIGADAMSRSVDERFLIASAAKEKGMAVFSAASESQAALELESLSHGLFTYCVLEALGSKRAEIARDGVVSIGGLLDYVNRAVRDYAAKYLNVEQTPVMFNFGDNFSLGAVR